MLVGGRARGGKQRRATIASVLGIEAGEKEGAGQVHSDAAHCHTAPGQSQLDCLEQKATILQLSRREREDDDD